MSKSIPSGTDRAQQLAEFRMTCKSLLRSWTSRSILGVALTVSPLGASLAWAAPASASSDRPTRVESVVAENAGDDVRVRIRCDAEPTFTVFRLDEPSRIVIDLSRADVGAVKADAVAARGPLLAVSASQFDDPRARVGRLVLTVEKGTRYDVKVDGRELVVELRAGNAAPSVAAAPARGKPAATVKTAKAEASAAKSAPAVAAAPRADDKVVRVEVDSLPEGSGGGSKLLDVRLKEGKDGATLDLVTDGAVARYQIIELKEPARLALDLTGFTEVPKARALSAGPVRALRVGRHADYVRVVLEADGDKFPAFETTRTRQGLRVTVSAPAAPKAALVAEARPEPKPTARPAPVPATGEKADPAVRSIDVSGKGRVARVAIALSGDVTTQRETLPDGSYAITLIGAHLPKELERRLDTSALDGPIASVASYQTRIKGQPAVRLVASLHGTETSALSEIATGRVGPSTGLIWTLTAQGPRSLPASAVATGGFMGEAPAYAMAAAPRAAAYTGKRVDFTVKDLDIKYFFQAIGEVSRRNIVVADDVSGNVTLRLRNVPWDEALDIVLRSKGLGKEEVGNIIRIAPSSTLAAEREQAAKAAELKERIDPLKVRLIPVNYADASQLADRVKDVLTGRGTVSVDARTNVLIVKDVVDSLTKAELLVRNLDTQTPQVLIEARIVEAQTSFTRSIGIQWGGDVRASPSTGNPTGLLFPNLVAITGSATDGQTPTSGTSSTPNFAVNMPTAIGTNTGGGVGFIFGSAGGAANLNLRLSAAEVNGTIKTVSAPKVTTLDNQSATISQGVSIPFSQVSAGGVNTAFIEARLNLTVTPHVTQDGSIQLTIQAQNNQPNENLTGANGQPSISRREANTNVLVRDGDTTVIGGIYTRRNALNTTEVPFLSKIPILGKLFSKDTVSDDRTEMLIFITPRIVNRHQATVSSEMNQ